MVFIKKHFKEIIFVLAIFLLFLITRFYNILALPIFTDEAIYVRWMQIAKQDASWRFISLTDGKQPLFIWIGMILLKFINDPLLAGRMVSVGAGLIGSIGLFFLGREIFRDKRVGYISSLIYIIYPFAIVYDKIALYDSLVFASAVWALYLEILHIKYKRLDLAIILGMVIGAGLLTKTSAFFFIYLLPFSLILFNLKDKARSKIFLKWSILSIVSILIAYSYYSILRLSPFFHIINEKNTIFVYPLSEWIKHPIEFLVGNFRGLLDWLIGYITIPFLLLVISSFFLTKKFTREKLLLIAWFIVPFIALGVFGRVLYPRFIFFMTMPLIVLGSYALLLILDRVKPNIFKVLAFLIFTVLMLRADFYLLSDFARAPIPRSDTGQYMNGWSAGGGVKETVEFFKDQAKDKKIYIGTEGTFGLMPYSLEIYLVDNPNIEIKGFWPIPGIMPEEIAKVSKEKPTYLIFYQPCVDCVNELNPPSAWPVKIISSYRRGIGPYYLSIYQVK